jgi:hypothetical protein
VIHRAISLVTSLSINVSPIHQLNLQAIIYVIKSIYRLRGEVYKNFLESRLTNQQGYDRELTADMLGSARYLDQNFHPPVRYYQ